MRLLAVLVFSLGLVFSGFLAVPWLPSFSFNLILADLAIASGIVVAFYQAYLSERRLLPPLAGSTASILNVILLFLIFSCISATKALSHEPGLILESTITILNYVYGFLISLCIISLARNKRALLLIIAAWLAGGLIVSAISASASLGFGPSWAFHSANRIKSTTRAVNQLQNYLAPMLPVFLAFLFIERSTIYAKVLALLGVILVLWAMLFTGSRSATIMAAFFLMIASFMILTQFRRWPVLSTSVLAAVGLAIVYVGSVVVNVMVSGLEALPAHLRGLQRPLRLLLESDDLNEQLGPRAEQLEIVIQHWDKTPLLGVGPGLFQDVFNYSHEVHNTFAALLIEHGSIGLTIILVLFVFIFVYSVINARQCKDKDLRLLSIAFAFSTVLLFMYCMSSFGLRQRSFWITLGFALAVNNLATPRVRMARPRAPLWEEKRAFPR